MLSNVISASYFFKGRSIMTKRGFSLIELLVVVAIITVLVGVATPYYSDYVRESRLTKARQDLAILKQAVLVYNSQNELPYMGLIATGTTSRPTFGERDFDGLQGRYLGNIPVDPWDRNYKLDPYGSFVYSEGPDPTTTRDHIRDYYVRDLALVRIEWEDLTNTRTIEEGDLLYFHFNKPLFVEGTMDGADFDIFIDYQATDTYTLNITDYTTTAYGSYTETTATASVMVAQVDAGTDLKVGVHSLVLKDNLTTLHKYREVILDREATEAADEVRTKVEFSTVNPANPLRFAVSGTPIRITPMRRHN